MHVVGTAGHVDHGKSTLVEALTGINPDRLKEERERAMTIDLGFAWLDLPGGETVGVIDVPGHRDFIENMLAGVGGIDAALFVVAADEGVMPQTREHLAILDLLNVPAGIVALTKVDLVPDADWLALVEAELSAALDGTVLAGAEVTPVSARTGEGLDALRGALARCLATVPPRPDRGRPRLPIDRVFTMAGFGTVVTGTLSGGRLELGEDVEVFPGGLHARVRGLQTHRARIETAHPGSRVAINLAGLSTDQLRRGDVVARPGQLQPTKLLDVQLRLVADAAHALKHNTQVKFFCGAAEIVAWVRLLGAETLRHGESGWAQLRLAEPVALTAGDRFILRTVSPGATVGGGRVIDTQPGRRHRRFKPEVLSRLETLARGTPAELAVQVLDRQGVLAAASVLEAAGLGAADTHEEGLATLQALLDSGEIVALVEPQVALDRQTALMSRASWTALLAQVDAQLAAYHRMYPLRQGMPREELKSRLKLDTRTFSAILTRAGTSGAESVTLTPDGASARLASFMVRLSAEQQGRVDALEAAFARDPVNSPAVKDAVAAVGADVYAVLLDRGKLVQVAADVVFLGTTYAELVERVRAHVVAAGSITVAEARDLFSTSRKYALALLEHLDQQGVTVRRGDQRVLR